MKKFYRSLKRKAEEGAIKKRPKKMGYLQSKRLKRDQQNNSKKSLDIFEVPQRLTCRPQIRDGIKSILKNKSKGPSKKGFFKKRVNKKSKRHKVVSRKHLTKSRKYQPKNGTHNVQRPKPRVSRRNGETHSKKSVTFSVKDGTNNDYLVNSSKKQDQSEDISSFANHPKWITADPKIQTDNLHNINAKANKENKNGLSLHNINKYVKQLSQQTIQHKQQTQPQTLVASNLLSLHNSFNNQSPKPSKKNRSQVGTLRSSRKVLDSEICNNKIQSHCHSLRKSRCWGCGCRPEIGKPRSRKKIIAEIDKNQFRKRKEASLVRRRKNYKNYTFRLKPKRAGSLQTKKQSLNGKNHNKRAANDAQRRESTFYHKTSKDSLILEYTNLLGQIERDIKQGTSFKPGNISELQTDKMKEIKNNADLEQQISNINRNSKVANNFKIQKVFDTVVFLHPEKQDNISNMVNIYMDYLAIFKIHNY